MQEHISQKSYIFFIIVNILIIKTTCFKMVAACYYTHYSCNEVGKNYNKYNWHVFWIGFRVSFSSWWIVKIFRINPVGLNLIHFIVKMKLILVIILVIWLHKLISPLVLNSPLYYKIKKNLALH